MIKVEFKPFSLVSFNVLSMIIKAVAVSRLPCLVISLYPPSARPPPSQEWGALFISVHKERYRVTEKSFFTSQKSVESFLD